MTDRHQYARDAAAEVAFKFVTHSGKPDPNFPVVRRTPEPPPPRRLEVTVSEVARILHRRGAPERDVAPGTWETLVDRPVWREQAVCNGMRPAFFYPERGDSDRQIRLVCDTCPVRAECLAYALNTGEKHGWWGGLSEKQVRTVRGELFRRTGQPVSRPSRGQAIAHGEARGYMQHIRRPEGDPEKTPCEDCRAAAARDAADRRVGVDRGPARLAERARAKARAREAS